MKKAESILRDALADTGAVIPLHSKGRGGYVEFLCRQMPGHEARWLSIVESVLHWAELKGHQEALLIARRYLIKDNRMVFGWFISLDQPSAAKLQVACEGLVAQLAQATKAAEGVSVEAAPRRPSQPVVRAPQPSVKGSLLRVIRQGVDDQGRKFEESVMPLPHVTKDLNVPSKPRWSEEHGRYIGGQRGAKYTGEGR